MINPTELLSNEDLRLKVDERPENITPGRIKEEAEKLLSKIPKGIKDLLHKAAWVNGNRQPCVIFWPQKEVSLLVPEDMVITEPRPDVQFAVKVPKTDFDEIKIMLVHGYGNPTFTAGVSLIEDRCVIATLPI